MTDTGFRSAAEAKAYAKYRKAMDELHEDAIPNEPLPPFYHSPEYSNKWCSLTKAYFGEMKALGFKNYDWKD